MLSYQFTTAFSCILFVHFVLSVFYMQCALMTEHFLKMKSNKEKIVTTAVNGINLPANEARWAIKVSARKSWHFDHFLTNVSGPIITHRSVAGHGDKLSKTQELWKFSFNFFGRQYRIRPGAVNGTLLQALRSLTKLFVVSGSRRTSKISGKKTNKLWQLIFLFYGKSFWIFQRAGWEQ